MERVAVKAKLTGRLVKYRLQVMVSTSILLAIAGHIYLEHCLTRGVDTSYLSEMPQAAVLVQ